MSLPTKPSGAGVTPDPINQWDYTTQADRSLGQAADDDGRGWDRTSDLPRVKRALSR
jgi:hypothetical protein